MAIVSISCIVEGHGEAGSRGQAGAVEILVRRVAGAIDPTIRVNIALVHRISRGSLTKRGGIESAVERIGRKMGSGAIVLVVLDSDDDAREVLEASLIERATQARADLHIAVVAAKREFEAWFLAAAASLAGFEGLPNDLQPPSDPENVRGAKEWLSKHMVGAAYEATLHQALFTRRFDLQAARSAASFEHCYQTISRLLAIAIQPEEPKNGTS